MRNLPIDQFQGLLFDLDGTLADSMPLHHQAWLLTLEKYGHTLKVEDLLEYSGVPTLRIVEILNERFGWQVPAPAFATEKELLAHQSMNQVQGIPPVIEIAKKYAGLKPMAIVSGGTSDSVDMTLKAIGLAEIFAIRVCAGDTARGKPSPDPFLLGAQLIKVPAHHCLVFEDGNAGIEGARLAGMGVIKVGAQFDLTFLGDHESSRTNT